MVQAVNRIIRLGPESKIFPGHEYTVSNLKFSQFFEPDNTNVEVELNRAKEKIKNNKFTIPTTVKNEKKK